MNEEFLLASPIVIPESIIVRDEGDLPKGLYYYFITSGSYNESSPCHTLQVYAPHKENSIIFSWKSAEGGSEYRIYRGTTLGKLDGYFTIQGGYFCDDGRGELNENIWL
jgi:hypothetical protein